MASHTVAVSWFSRIASAIFPGKVAPRCGEEQKLNREQIIAGLLSARALIEKGWCQGALARNAKGIKVGPQSRAAVTWDAYGASIRATGNITCLHECLWGALPPDADVLGDYNDAAATAKEDILALYDRAITSVTPMTTYKVVVGDRTEYSGPDKARANDIYEDYVNRSDSGSDRSALNDVKLLVDGVPAEKHTGLFF